MINPSPQVFRISFIFISHGSSVRVARRAPVTFSHTSPGALGRGVSQTSLLLADHSVEACGPYFSRMPL